jgi:4-hydroxy-3-methylbut-2-en-1-yl diphosphate reductase
VTKPPLTLYLAAPRGFCAGVDRAIKIVEMALEKWGAPVYVRHEIVHNRYVVDGLRAGVPSSSRSLTTARPTGR